ncbi:MAG TPA: hypothetical protein VM925_30500 [Labilithrix sp.]|nr:hypothetical protein [Labilithrix sp.]
MLTDRLLLAIPLFVCSVGCVEKEALDPGDVVREETVNRVGPPSRATARTVRCACDADGDLHIRAPQGSQVTVPEDASHPAEAEIVLPSEAPGTPLRQTKSLGFIGDGKLSSSASRGGPWNVPDALLPPHRHVEPRYSPVAYGYLPAPSRYFGPPANGARSWNGGAFIAPVAPPPSRPSTPMPGPGWR